MEIAYQRNLKKSYVIIKMERCPGGYDEKVLKKQRCGALLPLEVIEQDEKTEYWFEVSGKQSLDVYASVHVLDEEFFQKFLCGLSQTVEWLERHLLDERHLMLLPDTIFLDVDTKNCSFCYCPAYEEELTKQFQGLMEELLKKIDHGEEGAVRLAYKLYDISLKEGYQLVDLKGAANEVAEDRKQRDYSQLEESKDTVDTCMRMERQFEEEMSENLLEEREKTIFERIIERIKSRNIWLTKNGKKKEEVPMYFEPEEEISVSHPTVLLAQRETGVQGILLYEGGGEQEDLEIKEVPFLIGSDEARVQGVIKNETVSRIHAKITKEGEIYFLEDLNSTNGTFLNEEMLNYKVKTSLNPNSKIRFANESYRFL
ncbi:MAG: DUF6382 domain-containing protein [Roseburia sp.]